MQIYSPTTVQRTEIVEYTHLTNRETKEFIASLPVEKLHLYALLSRKTASARQKSLITQKLHISHVQDLENIARQNQVLNVHQKNDQLGYLAHYVFNYLQPDRVTIQTPKKAENPNLTNAQIATILQYAFANRYFGPIIAQDQAQLWNFQVVITHGQLHGNFGHRASIRMHYYTDEERDKLISDIIVPFDKIRRVARTRK